ncbi:UNVERIFIED_CONTAM: hypothetical protein GTU68_043646 [Idotea baltica]|nr:hypothetical protein [Idotea baltica]
MRIVGIQTSKVEKIEATGTGEWWDKTWETGFFKTTVTGPQWLAYGGFRGDAQADRINHGGVDKAVCVYPVEHYPHWINQLGRGMNAGAFGENLTTKGLLETEVCVGDIFEIGGARLQISQPRQPCWKLARRWQRKDLTALVERTGKTGFYFRVLEHGYVENEESFSMIERPFPDWTIERCNKVMHHQKKDAEASRQLASECTALAGSWKDALWARANR